MSGESNEAAPAAAPEAAVADNTAPPAEEQQSTNDALREVSAMPETLHMAARAGTVETVSMLLRNKADPQQVDMEGKTPLQYAQEAGKADVVKTLREAMGLPAEEPAAATPAAAAAPAPAASPKATTFESNEFPAAPAGDAVDNALRDDLGGGYGPTSPGSPATRVPSGQRSPGGTTKPDDLKARTMFSQSTTDGVMKRTTFISKLSTYASAPEITIGSRGEGMFQRAVQGPAPGSYNLPDDEKSKFKTSARFSFGGGSRFGLGASPTKLQPGPGAYNPRDPSLLVDTKVGFGTSVRQKGIPASQAAPGPGAYECRATVGGGLMFTARGRHPTSYMRSRSLPGPGAYTPTLNGAYQASPKCGFGTSTRGEFGGNGSRGQPGPGTYEMQNFKCVGKDSAKFSATSRRRMHDLNSYVTPGPGTYNAHATSFGSPGAYSCRHVDEGYTQRNSPGSA